MLAKRCYIALDAEFNYIVTLKSLDEDYKKIKSKLLVSNEPLEKSSMFDYLVSGYCDGFLKFNTKQTSSKMWTGDGKDSRMWLGMIISNLHILMKELYVTIERRNKAKSVNDIDDGCFDSLVLGVIKQVVSAARHFDDDLDPMHRAQFIMEEEGRKKFLDFDKKNADENDFSRNRPIFVKMKNKTLNIPFSWMSLKRCQVLTLDTPLDTGDIRACFI